MKSGRLLAGLLVAAGIAMGQPGAGFAVIGVAASQTARINVFNEAAKAGGTEMVFACRVVLQFYGADGQLLKEKTIEDLGAGKIAFLDLTADDRPAKETRTPIRAVARFGYAGGASPPRGMIEACQVVPSLEIYDSESGKAKVVLTEPKALPPPLLPPA